MSACRYRRIVDLNLAGRNGASWTFTTQVVSASSPFSCGPPAVSVATSTLALLTGGAVTAAALRIPVHVTHQIPSNDASFPIRTMRALWNTNQVNPPPHTHVYFVIWNPSSPPVSHSNSLIHTPTTPLSHTHFLPLSQSLSYAQFVPLSLCCAFSALHETDIYS